MTLRVAQMSDIPGLERLIERSVMIGMAKELSLEQRKESLWTIFGVDRLIIGDGTYFVIEEEGVIIASGGWTTRKTLFGTALTTGRDDTHAVPGVDDTSFRACFVDPDHEGKGLGSRLLAEATRVAKEHGYKGLKNGATPTGVPFYKRLGWEEVRPIPYTLPSGLVVPLFEMRLAL